MAWKLVRRLNRFVEETQPWVLAKDEADPERLDEVLYNLVEGLRVTTLLLVPYLPQTSETLLAALGEEGRALAELGSRPGGQSGRARPAAVPEDRVGGLVDVGPDRVRRIGNCSFVDFSVGQPRHRQALVEEQESKVSELLTKVTSLEAALANLAGLEAVVGSLCTQTETLTDQLNALEDVVGGIKLNTILAVLLEIPVLPGALPSYNCPTL